MSDTSPASGEDELARFEFIPSEPSTASYAYDSETGILSIRFDSPPSGEQGAIELSDVGGGILFLHTKSGVVDGLEIVIWPVLDADGEVDDPIPTDAGIVVPPLEIDEVDCELVTRVNSVGTIVHIAVNDGYAEKTIALADNFLLDVDEDSELTGIWMLDVPEGVAVTM